MPHALYAESIVKKYGQCTALNGVDLSVKAGEIFGFLGPNGAGKSTFIKIMLGLIEPTSGRGEIFGSAISRVSSRAVVGYLPENIRAYGFLTVEEFIVFHAELAGVDRRRTKSMAAESMHATGIDAYRHKRIESLSKGMLQRTGICQAMLGKPKILFLDEPTSGLDPIGIQELRAHLQQLKADGTTLFINSHLLSEVERTCDRIAILSRGSIIKSGCRADLSSADRHLEVILEGYTDSMGQALAPLCVKPLCREGNRLKLYPRRNQDSVILHRIINEQGGALQSLAWKGEALEDLFYRLIKNETVANR
jgi:ABC-2 type transport system ATP-binding protein